MADWHAYCGIDCRSCELYKVTFNDDLEGKISLAEKWGANYKRAFSVEEMECLGCKSDNVFILCAKCDIKVCCDSHETESCKNCMEFKCERITQFYDYQKSKKTEVKYY